MCMLSPADTCMSRLQVSHRQDSTPCWLPSSHCSSPFLLLLGAFCTAMTYSGLLMLQGRARPCELKRSGRRKPKAQHPPATLDEHLGAMALRAGRVLVSRLRSRDVWAHGLRLCGRCDVLVRQGFQQHHLHVGAPATHLGSALPPLVAGRSSCCRRRCWAYNLRLALMSQLLSESAILRARWAVRA